MDHDYVKVGDKLIFESLESHHYYATEARMIGYNEVKLRMCLVLPLSLGWATYPEYVSP
jgi:hypothetical protein